MTKQQRLNQAIKRLRKNFSLERLKNGDLVITAEIAVVVDVDWGKENGQRKHIAVVDVWPKRHRGEHIVTYGQGGQQSVMLFKQNKPKKDR
jgi:hypothetical protein